MASLERTIKILFEGDDQTSNAFKSVAGRIDSLSGFASQAAQPFASLANGVLAADAALVSIAATTATLSVAKFSEFEDVMLKVKGIIQATGPEYEKLTGLAKEMGATTKFTAIEAAGGLEFLARAGIKTEEALDVLPTVLNLAAAASSGLAETADIVTNIMAGYGIEAKKVVQASDVLTATFTNSNTSIEQLGQAFKFVGPVAKSLGIDIETTSAALGVLGNAGYQAEMGGTALRNILLALIAPMGNAGKLMKEMGVDTAELGVDLASSSAALKSLGVNVKGADGNLRPLTDILRDLDEGLKKIPSSADRTGILIEIFGKRGGPQLQALLNQGVGSIEKLEGKIRNLGGITERVAKEMESGLGGAQRALKSAFEGVLIEIGEALSKGLPDAFKGLAEVFRSLRKEIDDGTFDPLLDVFEKAVKTFGEDMVKIAKLMPEAFEQVDFSEFVEELQNLGLEIGNLFEGIDLTTPEGLADALQKVVNTITGLVRVTIGIGQQFKPFFDAVVEGISQVREMDRATAISFGNILGSAKLITDAGVAIAGAFFVIQQSGAQLENVFNALLGSARFVWNAMQVGFDSLSNLVLSGIDTMLRWAQVVTNIPGMPDEWRESVAESRRELLTFRDAINEHQTDQITEMMDAGAQAMRGFTGETKDARKEVDGVHDSVKETSDEIKLIPPSEFKAHVDKPSFDDAKTKIKEAIPKETTQTVKAKAEIDQKQMQAELHLLETKVKASADIIQTEIEWEAKLDIAQVEANAEKVKSIVEGLTDAYEASTDLIGSLFGDLKDLGNSATETQIRWRIFEQMEKENLLREEQLKIIKELAEAEIRMMEAQRERFQSDDALITFEVDGSRLHDALEYVLYEMLKWTQIKAGEEDVTALLGLVR